MTKEAWIKHARSRFDALCTVSETAALEAATQAGLPDPWVWGNLTAHEAYRLAIACQIRLGEV